MEFLSSPTHNYPYEPFLDDGFFKLPTEMDLEVGSDTRDAFSVNEYEDLNDGLYGSWKDVENHPWTLSNPPSAYSSNPHLDFIDGGDPDSAKMVNPHIVMPFGFQLDEGINSEKMDAKEILATIPKTESKESSTQDDVPKKFRSKLLFVKGNIASVNENRTASKSGIRVLKSVEPDLSSSMGGSQKVENTSSRLKTPKNVPSLYYQEGQFYPKPAFSYSCLIAMALKNSKNGCLPVAEIYNFMCNHFPYFKTAPNGWKNSVRHNLSLNKCFEKIEKPAGSTQRKGCLWALNPSKAAKLEEEVQKCTKKDVTAIKRAMEYPEHLELLERGELKSLYDADQMEDDEEDDEIDLNDEEDVETEEPTQCEEDLIDERFSEDESESVKTENDGEQFPALNGSGSSGFPEFKIEVDDSIYEELIGSIKSEQLFSLSDAAVKTGARISPAKKVKKYFIEVNSTSVQKNAKTDSEIFDHYDINNLLRLESETKSNQGMNKKSSPQRFNRRVCPNARIKQIKFKTWN